MNASPPRRVCFAPTDVASYYSGLREGLEGLGVKCWFFSFSQTKYDRYRPRPTDTWIERAVYWLASRPFFAASRTRERLREIPMAPLRVIAFLAAVACCDVFVFAFGQTFFRRLELPLLRVLGKRLIFVFNGSDTRPAWMSGLFLLGPGCPNPAAIVRETRRQRRCLRQIERYADEMICHPLSAQLLTRPFVNHLLIGHPFFAAPSAAADSNPRSSATAPLRVLHAPTRPLQKGSLQFRAEIERLRAVGVAVDYVELTNQPNDASLRALRNSDIVLDQLFSDIPLASFATEAAALGRPCLVGGYAREEIERLTAQAPLPMAHFTHPDELGKNLLALARDPARRATLADELKTFASENWSPRNVALRFLRLIDGTAPASWRVDPATLRYWQGWGAPEAAVRRGLARVIAHAGVAAFDVAHNPNLEAELGRQAALAVPEPTP